MRAVSVSPSPVFPSEFVFWQAVDAAQKTTMRLKITVTQRSVTAETVHSLHVEEELGLEDDGGVTVEKDTPAK